MPQNVKDLCVSSYRDIAPRIETSGSNGFTYQGVRIVPIWKNDGMDLKFSYQGHTVVVKNYTKAEFDCCYLSLEDCSDDVHQDVGDEDEEDGVGEMVTHKEGCG